MVFKVNYYLYWKDFQKVVSKKQFRSGNQLETFRVGTNSSGVWWSVVPNFNLNHRHKFKPPLNFIFEIKTKSKFTFQVDIQNQIDLFFPLYFVFRLLSWLISHFNDQVQFNEFFFKFNQFFFSYFIQSRVFLSVAYLRQLIQPDLESQFIVRSQLGPSIQSGSSPSAGLQMIT